MESLRDIEDVKGNGDDGTELYGVAGGVCGTGLSFSLSKCFTANSSLQVVVDPNN